LIIVKKHISHSKIWATKDSNPPDIGDIRDLYKIGIGRSAELLPN
jgi:hypothetical protein